MKNPLIILRTLVVFTALLPFSTKAQTACEADHTILLTNFSFTPSELTILPGESVAFINIEGIHTVNGINNTVTSNPFENPFEFFLEETEGNSLGTCMGVITFDEPGTYNFDCSVGFHAQLGMTGQIIADAFTLADALDPYTVNVPDAFQATYGFFVYYDSLLNSTNNYTVFVPNEQAVNDVKELMNIGQFDMLAFYDLQTALGYHIAEGTWSASQLSDGLSLSTVQGQNLTISEENGSFSVDGATIIGTDYFADNGVIHIIDKCLAPQGYPKATVWDIIQGSPDHTYLETAIINSGLVEKLREQAELNDNEDFDGPFTLFAPTDAAMEALAAERGETITELINGQYIDKIVKNHLMGSRYLSDNLFNGQLLLNYLDEFNQISIDGGTLSIDEVPVTEADVRAYNGVVHIIEQVLSPDLPPVSGTCGTWSLVMKSSNGLGWGESAVEIVIDGETISTETLVSGSSGTYQFGVDTDAEVSFFYLDGPNDSSVSYEVYNSSNQLVFASQNQGIADYSTGNVVGLKACEKATGSCGTYRVEMYNDFGEGWNFGSLSIVVNDELFKSVSMPVGYAQFFYFSTAIGDEIDFVYQAGAFNEENSFIVYDADGAEIVNQFSYLSSPDSEYGIIACPELTSTEDIAISEVSSVYPNPSSGILNIKTSKDIDRVIIRDMNGKVQYNEAYSNKAINVSNLKTNNYILTLKSKDEIEHLKFSIIR